MRLTHDTTAKTPHSRPSAPLQPAYVVSALLDRVSEAEALERLFATPPSDRARMCHFAHAHALNLAAEDIEQKVGVTCGATGFHAGVRGDGVSH